MNMQNKISNNPEIFLLWSDKLTDRLDPLYYSADVLNFIRKTKFEIVELGDAITFIKAGFAAGKQNQDESENGIIQIRPTNIGESGELVFDKAISLPANLVKERPQDIVQKGEVLFNNTNSQELVGKSAYFNLDGNYFCSNHITRIKTNDNKLLPQFLWLLLNVYQKEGVFFRICVNWNNQSGVNVESLKAVQIPLPPIQQQRQAIVFVQKAYKEKQKKEKEIQRLLASIDDYVLGELGIATERERERE